MTTVICSLLLLATTVLPPPPGVCASAPSLQEAMGLVPPVVAFEGTYDVPFAEARVRFEGHARAHGWRTERSIVLGSRQGVDTEVVLSFTNRADRLTALLSRVRPRRTALQYQVEAKAAAMKGDLKNLKNIKDRL